MRRFLQVLLIVLAIIPLFFGSLNLFVGAERFLSVDEVNSAIDSQFRFQSAWYLALAFIILWIVPRIEKERALFTIIVLFIFIGGLARVWSWYTIGDPPPLGMQLGMYLELFVPVLLPLQAKLARASG